MILTNYIPSTHTSQSSSCHLSYIIQENEGFVIFLHSCYDSIQQKEVYYLTIYEKNNFFYNHVCYVPCKSLRSAQILAKKLIKRDLSNEKKYFNELHERHKKTDFQNFVPTSKRLTP